MAFIRYPHLRWRKCLFPIHLFWLSCYLALLPVTHAGIEPSDSGLKGQRLIHLTNGPYCLGFLLSRKCPIRTATHCPEQCVLPLHHIPDNTCTRARTEDLRVKSSLLCQLSYTGSLQRHFVATWRHHYHQLVRLTGCWMSRGHSFSADRSETKTSNLRYIG